MPLPTGKAASPNDMTDDLAAVQAGEKFAQGLALHQSGKFSDARAHYEQALALQPSHIDAMHLLGVLAAQGDDPARAVDLIGQALELDPGNAAAWSNRGNALTALERFDDALEDYARALQINPGYAEAFCNRGNALARKKQWRAALDSFERALELKPAYAEACYNRGRVLREMGRIEDALASYDRAIGINPGIAQAHLARGNALKELRRSDAALQAFDQAIELQPAYAEGWSNRGNLLGEMGLTEAAMSSYERALQLKPDYAEVHYNRGNLLKRLKRWQDALAAYDEAIRLNPSYADACTNRGNVLNELRRWEAAIASYDRSIAINPESAEAFSNRAMALGGLNRWDAALASVDRAIALQPDFAQAHVNRGMALQGLQQWDAALHSFERAIELQPDYAEARSNRGVLRLFLGDFARGWDDYEWRLKAERFLEKDINTAATEWDGSRLEGSLLVLGEQGVGDEIFYSGMLDDLRPRAASISVCVDDRLVGLLQRSFPDITAIPRSGLSREMHFDAHVRMGSLGRHLRRKAGAVAGSARPYLRASDTRIRDLRAQVAQGDRLVCGLSWQSMNAATGADKSLRLADLEPLLNLPGINFVDLQYGDTSQEREALVTARAVNLMHIGAIDNFLDLDGLAALISACDVIVTVSNTTAHLAAALGRRVLVMLPYSAGLLWYWHADREDCPWYAATRLVRQNKAGDWTAVVESVRRQLQAIAAAH